VNGLDSRLVWIYIGIGVIANVITGLLLMPLLKGTMGKAKQANTLKSGR